MAYSLPPHIPTYVFDHLLLLHLLLIEILTGPHARHCSRERHDGWSSVSGLFDQQVFSLRGPVMGAELLLDMLRKHFFRFLRALGKPYCGQKIHLHVALSIVLLSFHYQALNLND